MRVTILPFRRHFVAILGLDYRKTCWGTKKQLFWDKFIIKDLEHNLNTQCVRLLLILVILYNTHVILIPFQCY